MRALLLTVTALFTAFSLAVIAHTGVAGFYAQLIAQPAGWQVLADLVIGLGLVLVWLWRDAQRHGRRFWPWLLLTLVLGSIGPLLYLLRRPADGTAPLSGLAQRA